MNKHVDAIVIGAGAGGGVIAKELACSGMKTVLFERGGCATYDYHPNDELMNQRLHIIGAVHGPDRRKSPYVEVGKGRIDCKVAPRQARLHNYSRMCRFRHGFLRGDGLAFYAPRF